MIIFTDASYSEQTKVAGLGFVIIDKKFDYKAGNFRINCQDNNVAELGAIAEALKFCQTSNLFKVSSDRTVSIITDSKYAVGRINSPNPNASEQEKEYIKIITEILDKCPLKSTIFQIKGHTKGEDKFSYYNNIADTIAGDYRYLGEIEKERNLTLMVTKKKKGKKR